MFTELRLQIGPGGKVELPVAVRQAMQDAEGDALVAWMDGEVLNIATPEATVRYAQSRVRSYVRAGSPLVEELLADRRREVEGE